MRALLPSLELNEEVLDQEWMGETPLDKSWQQKKSDSNFSTSRNIKQEYFLRNFQSVFVLPLSTQDAVILVLKNCLGFKKLYI